MGRSGSMFSHVVFPYRSSRDPSRGCGGEAHAVTSLGVLILAVSSDGTGRSVKERCMNGFVGGREQSKIPVHHVPACLAISWILAMWEGSPGIVLFWSGERV